MQLALTEGIGPILTKRLIDAAGSAQAACDAPVSLLKSIEGIGSAKSSKIRESIRTSADESARELERAKGLGVSIICPDDQVYPMLLRSIPDPPSVLYVKGSLEPRDLNGMAIVGSRRCSFY